VHAITVRVYDNAGNFVDKIVNVYIDTSPPEVFSPAAIPANWTAQDPEITFSTIDALSGIDHYEADAGSGFIQVTSPYIPALIDGVHQVSIRAFDTADNFREGNVKVYIDRSGPSEFYFGINHNWSVDYIPTWVATPMPNIYFHANDTASGLDRYEIKIDQGNYFEQESPYTPAENLADGKHNVTLKAYDLVGNSNERSFQVYIDTTPPQAFTPAVEPSIYSSDPRPTIEFSTTDSVSDIDHYEVSIDDGEFSEQESKYTTPALSDGVHKITVRAFDHAGNFVDCSINIFIDTTTPEDLRLEINSNEPYTNSSTVILDVECSDSLTGCEEIAFSVDGALWSVWEPFSSSKDYILNPGDGEKKVYVKVKDKAGNVAGPVFDSIIHDTTPPANLNIVINDNAEFTNSKNIDLDLSAEDMLAGLDRMAFSEDGETWTPYEPFTIGRTMDLTGRDGERTVIVRVVDKAGNFAEAYDSIILDTTMPHSLSIQINNGSATTNSTEITLQLNAEDDVSGVASMMFSTDEINWSDWEYYKETRTFSLNATEGLKTVYYKVKDRAGNVPESISTRVLYMLPVANDTNPDIEKPDPDTDVPENESKPAEQDSSEKGISTTGILLGISIIGMIIIIIVVLYSFNRKKHKSHIEADKGMNGKIQKPKGFREIEKGDPNEWAPVGDEDTSDVDWDD
jgi:uncharacterized protein (UPF0147 family)